MQQAHSLTRYIRPISIRLALANSQALKPTSIGNEQYSGVLCKRLSFAQECKGPKRFSVGHVLMPSPSTLYQDTVQKGPPDTIQHVDHHMHICSTSQRGLTTPCPALPTFSRSTGALSPNLEQPRQPTDRQKAVVTMMAKLVACFICLLLVGLDPVGAGFRVSYMHC